MGRSKKKVYEYDKEGNFVHQYESQQEVRDAHYSHSKGKYPLFQRSDIMELPNGNIISQDRIGREGIFNYLRRKQSPYVDRHGRSLSLKKVRAYNLDNELVAEFLDFNVMCNMMGLKQDLLWNRVFTSKGYGRDGLRFEVVK